MKRQRLLVVGSPDLGFTDVREQLLGIVNGLAQHGDVELVLICNISGEGHKYMLDWELSLSADERAWPYQVVGFSESEAVDYAKGHTVVVFHTEQCRRCRTVIKLAMKKRDWYSKKYARWHHDSIDLKVVRV